MMRIISGKHRGRIIKTIDNKELRPTTTKAREAIFSILSSNNFDQEDGKSLFEQAIILDICCGSGALGLEALSRGAQKLIAIDIEQDNINLLKENASKIGEINNVTVLKADACSLPKAQVLCDIIFIDPPYHKNLVIKILESLEMKQWLRNKVLIIVELEKQAVFHAPSKFNIVDHRLYGKTQIYILEYQS